MDEKAEETLAQQRAIEHEGALSNKKNKEVPD